jgi:hypothetical protein
MVGLSRAAFFACTLPQLLREFEAARRRAVDDHNRDVRLAWMMANLARHRRLPRLASILAGQKTRNQTPAQMSAVLHALASAHGFKVTKAKR